MATAAGNLHEVRRRATRDTLRQTALDLFGDRGYDDVTVSEIAAVAGVTERTFYRHFPTKEAVLFQDYQNRLEWLASALAVRPAGESVFRSLTQAVRSFPFDLETVQQTAVLRGRLLSPERTAEHMMVVQAAFAATLRDFVASRRCDHPDIQLLAAVAGGALAAALVAAVGVWGERGSGDDLVAIVDAAIDYLRTGLKPLR